MKLKQYALAVSLLSAISVSAAVNYLHIQTSEGNWKVISLDDADKLTFSSNEMQVYDKSGAILGSFSTTTLKRLQINESATEVNDYPQASVETITSADRTASVSIDVTSKTVSVLADGKLHIYNMAGGTIVSIPSVRKGDTVDISVLHAGAYIIELNGKSQKVVLK